MCHCAYKTALERQRDEEMKRRINREFGGTTFCILHAHEFPTEFPKKRHLDKHIHTKSLIKSKIQIKYDCKVHGRQLASKWFLHICICRQRAPLFLFLSLSGAPLSGAPLSLAPEKKPNIFIFHHMEFILRYLHNACRFCWCVWFGFVAIDAREMFNSNRIQFME